jgi:hypothetical protein
MRSGVADTPERDEWKEAVGSTLTHHGPCCDRARAWLIAMGRSYDFSSTDGLALAGPRWITQRWAWGPIQWPVAWCEAVKAETIDCGVFGAFALELFRAKGIEAYPGQLLRGCAEERISHWRRKWDAIPTAFNWIGTRVVYHEVSVVRTEADQARIYDPTEGFWLEPGTQSGHHGHLAIRAEIPMTLKWGEHELVNGRWTATALASGSE